MSSLLDTIFSSQTHAHIHTHTYTHTHLNKSNSSTSYSLDRQWVVQTTRPYGETPTMEWIGLIFRYGSSVWDAGRMLGEVNLREMIRDAPLSPSVHKILSSLGLTGLAQEWAAETLSHRHISDAYVEELIAPQVERGPNLRIPKMNGLAMIMAAAQEDSASKHAGGDFVERMGRVAQSLRGVDIRTDSKVTGIKRIQLDGDREAWLVQNEGFGHAEIEAFDQVIVAAPGLEQQRLIDNPIRDSATAYSDGGEGDGDDSDDDDDDDVGVEEAVDFDPVYVTFFTTSEPLRRPIPGADEAWIPPQVLFMDSKRGTHEVAYVRGVVRHRDDGSSDVEHLYRYVTEENMEGILSADPAVTWVYHRRVSSYTYHLFFYPLKIATS